MDVLKGVNMGGELRKIIGPAAPVLYTSVNAPKNVKAHVAAFGAKNMREVEALQSVVLISMPSPERAQALRLREGLWEAGRRENGSSGKSRAEVEVSSRGMTGECMLGSARVNWQGEIDGSV